ncbi:MAG: hypothetical protein LBU15_03165 [Rickettsiales bacterium]|jgi:cell division protein FtsB|nr:hypothetical protein [Rickettsiales bacterium]
MRDRDEKSIVDLIISIGSHVFLALYLIHHLVSGKYGLLSHRNMGARLLEGRSLLQRMEQEAKRKRNRIEGLARSNLDLDIFEEEARRNVGLIDSNEIVLIYNDQGRE